MKKKDQSIEELMDDLQVPEVTVDKHQRVFHLTLLNTRKSALLGVLLLLLPFFFLTGVIFSHYLEMEIPVLTSIYHWIADLDRQYGDDSVLNWIVRLLLLLGPLMALAVNLLAVLHVSYQKTLKEVVIALKLKWQNWLIIGICAGFEIVFFLYLILENA